jgi:hypothetical protein
MKIVCDAIYLALLTYTVSPTVAASAAHCYPHNGYVPDASTAIQIARAVGVPLIGFKSVREKVFSAKLGHGVWIVTGNPIFSSGELFIVNISQKTGTTENSVLAIRMHKPRNANMDGRRDQHPQQCLLHRAVPV